MDDLRYPIGRWTREVPANDAGRRELIAHIAATPPRMRQAVAGLSDPQLDTPYRPGGWTVRQVVHHVPDSHMNAYIRLKLALTEDIPLIKTYEESLWAQLADARAPIEDSLVLLERLHRRWDFLLGSMAPADFARRFRHPELGAMSIDELISLYSWHGRHHVAHIMTLRERMGWG
jgi:DinB family protein